MTLPVVLTIAGSDPSGGAGIQADLRTFGALGVVGLSVVTALTVQNSQGVQAVHLVSADVLAAQLEAVFGDTRFDAVKIGMLGGADQVRAVVDALRRYLPPNVVLDPVIASTGAVPLLDDAGRQALVTELLPLCDLVTPNQDEFPLLSRANAKAMLLKGGHLPGKPIDVLTLADGTTQEFSAEERVETPHTHGTGCFLSAAIAAHLARGQTLESAIFEAKIHLTMSLRVPVVVGQGRGYPDALRGREGLLKDDYEYALAKIRGIYVVTDSQMRPGRTHEDVVKAAIAGGATVIQFRDKSLPLPALEKKAAWLSQLSAAGKATFIINDRVDIALSVNADGVHLGPDDLPPQAARRILGPYRIIGVSVNSVAEAAEAAPWASYFGVGAIFGTQTKADAGAAIGVERITEIKAAFPHTPIVAIGGINAANIAEVARAGADAAAVVSAVVGAEDMAEATRELARRFKNHAA